MLNNKEYSFDNFIADTSNRFAYAVCISICTEVSKYNPCVLYGPNGCGKTHLLRAVKNHIEQNGKKALYITANQLKDDIINCIKEHGDCDKAYEKYSQYDALLIDNTQFLAGKGTLQEMLFKLTEYMCSNGKIVIFSTDRPPAELSVLNESIRKNFLNGIMADITAPSRRLRRLYLKRLCAQNAVNLTQEAIEYIISRNRCALPTIKGYVNRLKLYKKVYKVDEIDVSTLKNSLFNLRRKYRENRD